MGGIFFGAILRNKRAFKGWTQEQVAAAAGLSVRYVQALEANDKAPSVETMFKLSKALDTSPSVLLDPLWKDWKKKKALKE